MYKKVAALILSAVLLAVCVAYAAPASKKNKTFTTPDATEMNLMSCRFTQSEPQSANFDPARLQETDGYTVLLQNDRYAVLYNEERCNVKVLDKNTGYMWGSITEEDREQLNEQWLDMADSLVTVTYLNDECMSLQSSISGDDFSVTYTTKENRADFTADSTRLKLKFGFSLILHDDRLQIIMQEKSLEEGGNFLLESVYFMPFFGAVRKNSIDGYMFVPDGAGALIRYSDSTKYIGAFTSRVYGLDMAVDELKRINNLMAKRTNDYLTEQVQVTVPVFGVSHGVNKNAFLGVIDSGDNFANIYAAPAGYVTDFNYVTARFDFREVYQLSGGNGVGGINVNQENPNNCLPSVSYYFLSGEDADYSGMARTYREILKDEGVLQKSEKIDSEIPIRVEAVGSDIKNGKLFDTVVPFTTVSQAQEIFKKLSDDKISNITFVYSGFRNGGLNGADFDQIGIENKLGTEKELDALKNQIAKAGGELILSVNPVTANKDQIDHNKDAILTMSKKVAYFQRDNNSIEYPITYIVKPNLAVDLIKEYISQYKGFGLNFTQVGTRAYGDYARDRVILRDRTAYMFAKTVGKAKQTVALNTPNKYMWSATDAYFDLPLENSQFIYETDTVPFLSMVLKGSIDYYTPYINQGYYTTDYVLKMIEYGAYPSFLVMAENNEKISGTPSEDYFSLCFDDWRGAAKETYQKMNAVLKLTEGMEITDHTVIESGLVKVDYSGGVSIVINYNDTERSVGDTVVGSKACVVVKGAQ